MEQLTVNEINTLIEALDSWTSASKNQSLLAGLMFGAMVAGNTEGTDEEKASKGKEVIDSLTSGENEKQKIREEQAVILKAKLIKIRDQIEAKDFAQSI